MFANSEIIAGHFDYPKRSITNAEFVSRAGGIGWLKENFYRLLAVLDTKNAGMTIPIKEVAVYFGHTPLIHYYYLNNRTTANREISRQFFMKSRTVPTHIKDAVSLIHIAKHESKPLPEKNNALLEAAYNILLFVGDQFSFGSSAKLENIDYCEDEYSEIIAALIGRNTISDEASELFFEGIICGC
jgi:hypothetical protein